MKRLLAAAGFVLLFGVLGASGVVIHSRGGPTPLLASVTGQQPLRAPEGVRIRVQVLNTTKTRGLARRATRLLRDRGFDVVELGTVGPTMDTTVVLDLSGHPAWADAVAKVMAPARTRARRDSSRYLDVTVLVGSSWRPPAEPLDP
jgi:hypothetical protein